jgi:hypothetical protein
MRARVLLVAAGALALAGCATAPGETVITAEEAAGAEPADVAAPVTDNPAEGLKENEWGGEVPQSLPAGAVGEGGLGDIG